ncbi:MAG: Hsp20/alpha crystallin family protein [Betaproteobacteria bacterium]|nr:Hsp20/alpha crystallin family protein [Betaproteobacteria bacterium]
MVNITRFSPIDDAFDQLFRGFVLRPVAYNGTDSEDTVAKFRADIAEGEKAYTVRADLPGVKKEDIQISIDGDQVSISAEVRREKDVKDGERVLRSERYVGKFQRAFALGGDIDEATATAKYADGVLELTLPKKAAPAAKRITIQ